MLLFYLYRTDYRICLRVSGEKKKAQTLTSVFIYLNKIFTALNFILSHQLT